MKHSMVTAYHAMHFLAELGSGSDPVFVNGPCSACEAPGKEKEQEAEVCVSDEEENRFAHEIQIRFMAKDKWRSGTLLDMLLDRMELTDNTTVKKTKTRR